MAGALRSRRRAAVKRHLGIAIGKFRRKGVGEVGRRQRDVGPCDTRAAAECAVPHDEVEVILAAALAEVT